MANYTNTEIDSLPGKFNSINKKINDCIHLFTYTFEYEKLRGIISEIKDEYGDLKKKIADFSIELRINILEIDDLMLFEKYKKRCELRLKAIHKVLEPADIDVQLNIDNDKYLTHADLSKYSTFEIPENLNIYNLSGYLYTYSFMLLVLKKTIIGIVDNLQFKNLSDDTLSIINSDASSITTNIFKVSNKKGVRIDFIRILHTLYELRFIEDTTGQIPTKRDFMLYIGNFFGTDFSNYDSDLSQSLNNTTIEKNTSVFERMIAIIKKSHHTTKTK